MPRKMTVVFDDEDLYTALKVEAARTHRPAKDIVAEALAIHFEATPEEHDRLLMRARMKDYARRGANVTEILAELGLARTATEPVAVDRS